MYRLLRLCCGHRLLRSTADAHISLLFLIAACRSLYIKIYKENIIIKITAGDCDILRQSPLLWLRRRVRGAEMSR